MGTDIPVKPDPATPHNPVIASVLYRVGQPPLTVALDQVATYAPSDQGLLWIGLQNPDSALLEKLGTDLKLQPRAIEELISPHRRPKVVEYEQATLIVAITLELRTQHPHFGDTQLLIGRGFLITIRRGTTATYGEVRKQLECTPGLMNRGSDYVASTLLDLMVDRYTQTLSVLEKSVETVEQQLLLRGFRDADVRLLYRYRRNLLRIHTAIAPMAEVCRKVARVEMDNIDAESRAYFGEVADRIVRTNELISSLREALAFAFEASLMIGQAQQTDTTRKLAAWAAILAVPTAIAGIYGMNFHNMPELEWPYGYPAVLGSITVICGVLYWRFKKVKWL
ncbi:MAG: magnesium and cobalt transport protein CorA [Burkholderiaceae bacterium]|nr:magnesium and cobalt transport protein CorA [Burkholderiaceae bacterium]